MLNPYQLSTISPALPFRQGDEIVKMEKIMETMHQERGENKKGRHALDKMEKNNGYKVAGEG